MNIRDVIGNHRPRLPPGSSVNRRRCPGCRTRKRPYALVWWRAGHRACSDREAGATVHEKTTRAEKDSPAAQIP